MSSWPHARSRSRTSHRPRHQRAARSSRPSTITQQPPLETLSVPRGITGSQSPEQPAPDRHVLTLINFQSLADLSARREFTPDNVDFLDAECRLHLDALEEIWLFTWCRHFDHTEISSVSIRNLCHLVSTRIRETWDIRIPGHTLELRGTDSLGETVQIDEELSIGEALAAWFPRWRTWQQTSFHPELLSIWPRRPFVWRLSPQSARRHFTMTPSRPHSHEKIGQPSVFIPILGHSPKFFQFAGSC